MTDTKTRFAQLCVSSQSDQAAFFLRTLGTSMGENKSIVKDYAAKFDAIGGAEGTGQLDEMQVLKLLSDEGETLTRSEFRDKFKAIDSDQNGKVSFIEYLLFKTGKSLEDLFQESGLDDPIAQMEKAKKLEEELAAMVLAREEKIEKLKALVAAGGVKGTKAKHELELMGSEDPTELNRKKAEVERIKSEAAKGMTSADPFAAQKALLEQEAAAKKSEFMEDRRAAKERLRERAQLFGL